MAADYSIVRDKASGAFLGFWLRDPDDAHPMMLAALLMKHDQGAVLVEDAFEGRYDVMPNTVDRAGGCFVLFRSAGAGDGGRAPASGKKWWQFWR